MAIITRTKLSDFFKNLLSSSQKTQNALSPVSNIIKALPDIMMPISAITKPIVKKALGLGAGIGEPGAGFIGKVLPGVEKMTRLVEEKEPQKIKKYAEWWKEETAKERWASGKYTPEQTQYLKEYPERKEIIGKSWLPRSSIWGESYKGITSQEKQLFPVTGVGPAITGMEDVSRMSAQQLAPLMEQQAKIYFQKQGINISKVTRQQLQQSYFNLAHKLHPDKPTGNAKLFKELTNYYNIADAQWKYSYMIKSLRDVKITQDKGLVDWFKSTFAKQVKPIIPKAITGKGITPTVISKVPVIPTDLPTNISSLIGKTTSEGLTIRNITPSDKGFNATIVNQSGKESNLIINESNLEMITNKMTPPQTAKAVDPIVSQIANLSRQLDVTPDETQKALIQSQINKLQQVTIPKVEPTPQPITTGISSQLQPLAKEAMKYDSAEEFVKAVENVEYKHTALDEKYKPYRLTKDEKSLYNATRFDSTTKEGMAMYDEFQKLYKGQSKEETLTSIYTQAKGVGEVIPTPLAQKEVKGAVKPEISPITPEEILPPLEQGIIDNGVVTLPIPTPEEITALEPGLIEQGKRTENLDDYHNAPVPLLERPTKPTGRGVKVQEFAEKKGVEIEDIARYRTISARELYDKAYQFVEGNKEGLEDYILGTKLLPENIDSFSFTAAINNYVADNFVPKLAGALAKSPFLTAASVEFGQVGAKLAMTDPDSWTSSVNKVIKDRTKQALKTTDKTPVELQTELLSNIEKAVIKAISGERANTTLVVALQKGDLKIEDLIFAESEARTKILAQYLPPEQIAQADIELNKKHLLKHIDAGVANWIKKYGKIGRYDPTKAEEIQKLKENWKEHVTKRILRPKENEVYLNAIVNKQLGAELTQSESLKLYTLHHIAKQLLNKIDPKTGKFPTEIDRLAYGRAEVLRQVYENELVNPKGLISTITREMGEIHNAFKQDPVNGAATAGLKIADNINAASISMVASFDVSYFGRQGILTLMTHPSVWINSAGVIATNLIKTFKDPQEVMISVLSDVYSRPNYINGNYLSSGLDISLQAYPENVPESMIKHTPILGRALQTSDALFQIPYIIQSTGLFDYFYNKLNKVRPVTKAEVKGIGTLSNTLSAKGIIPGANSQATAKVLRALIWAPRMAWARISFMTGGVFEKLPPRVRWEWTKETLKVIFELLIFYAILRAFNKKNVGDEPTSSNFGKIMIGPLHDTSIDPTGGLAGYAVLAMRILTGKYTSSTTGKTTDLGAPKFGEPTRWDMITNFIEGKTTPAIGAIIDVFNNSMFGGKKVTPERIISSMLTPITAQNIADVREVEPYRQAAAIWSTIADFFGLNSWVPVRSIQFEQPIIQEIRRLQDLDIPDVQTAYMSGLLQENPSLSVAENKELFTKLTNIANKKVGGLIESGLYSGLTDEDKAKAISSFMNKNRDTIYLGFLSNRLQKLTGKELQEEISRFKQSGILTKTRFETLIEAGAINLKDLQK